MARSMGQISPLPPRVFGRTTELADRGVDENVIRSVTATTYTGETICQ